MVNRFALLLPSLRHGGGHVHCGSRLVAPTLSRLAVGEGVPKPVCCFDFLSARPTEACHHLQRVRNRERRKRGSMIAYDIGEGFVAIVAITVAFMVVADSVGHVRPV